MKSITVLCFVFFIFAAGIAGQTSEFTYQGRLVDGSLPASGTYQMQFSLYDTPTDGTQIGSTITNNAVSVTNGVFSVVLNFTAPNAFDGSPRFLAIAVKRLADPSFTPLTPRQPLTSAPYSIKSLNADTAANSIRLDGRDSAQYVITTDARMTDARTPTAGSGDYIQNRTTQQTLSNFNVSGTGTANTFDAGTQFNIGGSRVLSSGGTLNLFAGQGAGNVNTGFNNAFFGPFAGSANTDGSVNAFFGTQAGQSNVSGSENSFFGYAAGGFNQTGCCNSFFGRNAGLTNTTGQLNSFFGTGAGDGNISGSNNTFVGVRAGESNVGGNNNTMLGFNAKVLSPNLSFATAIGSGATINRSNQIVLGRSAGQDDVVIPGNTIISRDLSASTITSSVVSTQRLLSSLDAGIGTTTPTFKLHVIDESNTGLRVQTDTAGGTVASFGGNGAFEIDKPGTPGGRFRVAADGAVSIGTFGGGGDLTVNGNSLMNTLTISNGLTLNILGSAGATALCRNASNLVSICSSSLRYKANIAPFVSSLSLVNRLRPVTFNWKADNSADMGLVAEEVAEVEPLLVTHNDKGEVEGVKYDRVGVVLINAVKEQQAQIESQRKLIESQQAQIDALKNLVCQGNPRADICKK